MMVNRLPEKRPQFQKIRNLQSIEIVLVSNFDASSECCKRIEQFWPLEIEFLDPELITVISIGINRLLLYIF